MLRSPYPKAKTYIKAFSNGITKPHLIAFDDGLSYVVKFKGNNVGTHVLIKELVVSMITDRLEFSHRRGGIVEVGRTFIEGQPQLNGFEPGLQFGSPNLGNPFPFSDAHLNNLENKDELAQVIVLDTLFCNEDRHADNLLIVYDNEQQNKNCRFYVVDHSHVLGREQWGESVLQSQIGDQNLYARVVGLDHVPAKKSVFDSLFSRVESLDEAFIGQVVDAVPDQWDMKPKEAELLKELINTRKKLVRQIIEPHLS